MTPNMRLAGILTCVGFVATYAGPMSVVPVPTLIKNADLVIVGTVIQVNANAGSVMLTIATDRVAKGDIKPGTTIAMLSRSGIDATIRSSGEQGLFFGKKQASGTEWELLPITSRAERISDLYLPTPNGSLGPIYQATDTDSDKVLRELLAAVESGVASSAPIDLVGFMRTSPTQFTRAEIDRLSRLASSKPELRAAALKAGIALGDVRVLDVVRSERASLRARPQFADLSDYIKYYYRNPDTRGVLVLGQMLSEDDNNDRIAAASALAHIHTKDSLPFLAPLLDSPDPALRTCAVGGLALFANNVPIGESHPAQGNWKYRTDDTMRNSAMDIDLIQKSPEIVAFWKSWWQQNRTSIEQQ